MKSLAFFAAVAASMVFAGCAADTSESEDGTDSSEEALAARKLTEGTFRLYDMGVGAPSPSCQVYTNLVLQNKGARRPVAKLNEAVSGTCRLAVAPNFREFTVTVKDIGCGSFQFTGTRRVRFSEGVKPETGRAHTDADDFAKIVITDHRSRVCRDRVAGPIIVEETDPGFPGAITTKKRALNSGEPEVFKGELLRTFGIGGENTGVTLKTDSGNFELVLDAEQHAAFTAGRVARVTGTRTTLSGVETRDRPAIRAAKLLVCPAPGTWYNMMPGPRPIPVVPVVPVESSVEKDIPWELTNCPDVNAAY